MEEPRLKINKTRATQQSNKATKQQSNKATKQQSNNKPKTPQQQTQNTSETINC